MIAKQHIRTASLLVLACLLPLLIPALQSVVDALGYRIPSDDRGLAYLKGVTAAAIIALMFFMIPTQAKDRGILLKIWLARSLVTLVFMLFYEWNYGLDAFYYFNHSQQESFPWHETGVGNGTINIAGFLWFIEHKLVQTNSFHALKVIFSGLSLVAIYVFYRSIVYYVDRELPALLYVLGFTPSILFWSSTLGKDPIGLFGVLLFAAGFFRALRRLGILSITLMILGGVVSLLIRNWILPMLLIPVVFVLVFKVRSLVVRSAGVLITAVVLVFSIQNLSEQVQVQSLDELAASANVVSRSWQRGGSAGNVGEIRGMGDMIKALPVGAFTAIFRPLPGEINNAFGILAGLENALLLYFLLRGIRRSGFSTLFSNPALSWSVGYVLVWSSVYAFISPQNLGSAVRFKLQILPVLILILLAINFKSRDELKQLG